MNYLAAQLDASEGLRGQVAPGQPARVAYNTSAPETALRSGPVRMILLCGVLLIVAIAAGTGIMLSNLHSRALSENEREIKNTTLVLAKQMERDFDSVVSVQTSFIERIRNLGIVTSEEFQKKMSDYDTHLLLKDKVVGFNYLGALILVNSRGKIFNLSRFWPIPDINAADRDYFTALQSDAKLNSFVTKPFLNRATGTWIVQIARRVSGPNGEFLGLVLGAIELQSIEQYFARIVLGPNSAISLIHRDGELMARHPRVDSMIGRPIPGEIAVKLVSNSDSGVGRQTGTVGKAEDRLIAVHRIAGYPFLIVPTTSTAAVLSDWKQATFYMIGIAVLAILVVVAGAFLVIRQFKNHSALERVRTKMAEAEIMREQGLRLDAALENMSQGLIMFDSAARLVVCNNRYREICKLPAELATPGCTFIDILKYRFANGTFSGNPEEYVRDLLATISEGQMESREIRTADGRIISVVNQPMVAGGWVATHEDITERKQAGDELRRTKKFIDAVIEHVPLPIIVKDVAGLGEAYGSRFTLFNRAYEELTGESRTELIGKTAHELFPKERADLIVQADNEALRSDQVVLTSEHPIVTAHNGTRAVIAKKTVIRDEDGRPQYLLSVVDDVTERRLSDARIVHLAHYDSLTDLPNRTTFNSTLAATLDRARASGEQFAVLSIDLDHFKEANDTYGHMVGDTLLREVARRLQVAAAGAFAARLGGDEFVLIVADGGQPATASALADRLLTTFRDDFEVEGHQLKLGMSIGVAIYPTDGRDAKALIANADIALYRAKAEFRGSALFYEAEMGDRLRERHAMQEDLRLAIDRGELLLHYQPQLKMSGEIVGFEALVRWQCPKRGMVPPGTFIPVAEESGLIIPVGDWVLHEACREAASWPQPLTIAVNISPIQFHSGDLPKLVHAILLETGLAPARLELEVTEGVMISDFSRAVSILNQLKSLGVRIAMDDFGTGYSSLSYLQSFRCDKIKIDRVFICDLESNYHSRAIVRAVVGLGQSLNLPVLAEGVETEAQHDYLTQEGCDEVQGYLTGRPLPIEDYAELVGRRAIAQQRHAVAN
jgi:diguanylate cyclase (GGDEF)-like protein/PAS domain S-box-containing protein